MRSTVKWAINILPLFLTSSLFAQQVNSIEETTYLDSLSRSYTLHVSYYDGFGQNVSEIAGGLSGDGTYVATACRLDGLNRVTVKTLPIPIGQTLSPPDFDQLVSDGSSVLSDSHPFSTTSFDALGRPLSVQGAGQAWYNAGKSSLTEYGSNASGSVRCYSSSADGVMSEKGYFPANTLLRETHTDEDGHVSDEYKDGFGKKILSRVHADGTMLDTYYVYDSRGNLRFILQPQYQEDNDLERFAFEYKYDGRGNMIMRRTPQCGPTLYWYDNGGHLIFEQDPSLRSAGLLRFNLYDSCGRPVLRGRCSSDCSFHNGDYLPYARWQGEGGFLSTGYSVPESFNVKDAVMEKVWYYDSYSFLSAGMPGFPQLEDVLSQQAAGLLTGSVTSTSNSKYIYEVIRYDWQGLPVRKSVLYPNGLLDNRTIAYSFTNKPISEHFDYSRRGSHILSGSRIIGYNSHNDKPATEEYTVSLLGSSTLSGIARVSTTYDGLGRKLSISRGGKAGDISHAYNIRGWLSEINSPDFCMRIDYDGGKNPLYNGNTSGVRWSRWKSAFNRPWEEYAFTYDGACRLTSADYTASSLLTFCSRLDYSERVLDYSLNGAVRRLKRYGVIFTPFFEANKDTVINNNPIEAHTDSVIATSGGASQHRAFSPRRNAVSAQHPIYGAIDDLTITLDGNRPLRVTDAAHPLSYARAFDFRDDDNASDCEYIYNDAGALIADRNKGISLIEYDERGFPKRVQFANGNVTEYVYASDGRKLQTIHRTAVQGIKVEMGDSHVLTPSETLCIDSTDYAGEIEFRDGIPDRWLFGEGYFSLRDVSNGSPKVSAHYFTRDQQGSVRTVVSEEGKVEQSTDYYPFGAPFYRSSDRANTLQPYKYNSKELDLTHGLNTYDYGARRYDPVLCIWDGADPMADKFAKVSPYAFCTDNPYFYRDNNGMFVFKNISSNTYYKIIFVIPNHYEKLYDLEYQVIAFDNTLKNLSGAPIIMVDNMEDYANAMKQLKKVGVFTSSYDINSHGRENYFKIGNTEIETFEDLGILREGLKDKLIFIDACNVTSDYFPEKFTDLTQDFAEQTQSTVIASCHSIMSSSKYDGVDMFNEPFSIFHPNDQFNLFKMSIKGGQRKNIYNVRVGINSGISWNWDKDTLFSIDYFSFYLNTLWNEY